MKICSYKELTNYLKTLPSYKKYSKLKLIITKDGKKIPTNPK